MGTSDKKQRKAGLSLGRRRRIGRTSAALLFAAGISFGRMICPLPAHAQSANQETAPQTDIETLDSVTRKIMSDAFIALRFTALALDDPAQVGQALNGLVRAMLERNEVSDALQEAGRIEDDLWYARAMVVIADYYASRGENEQALTYLRQGADRINAQKPLRDGGGILREIAKREAALGQFDAAIANAQRIPSPSARVKALQEAASAAYDAGGGAKASRQGAAKVLSQAFEQAKQLDPADQTLTSVFLAIGRAQIAAGDMTAAKKTFDFTRKRIDDGPYKGRNKANSDLAAAMITGGFTEEAMQIVRKIPEGAAQATALASAARAMGEAGKIDSAVPIFILAREMASRVDDQSTRVEAYKTIVRDQASVGRLADAFTTAGSIKDRLEQSKALLAMAFELIRQKKYKEAMILPDYIPYLGMRAQLIGMVIGNDGEQLGPTEASAKLMQALSDTGFPIESEFLPQALNLVLSAQIKYGSKESDDAIFNRSLDLARHIDDEFTRIRALTQVAAAQAVRGRKEEADNTVQAAYRLAYAQRKTPTYPLAMDEIVRAEIAGGNILSAFDAAARIPKGPKGTAVERASDGAVLDPRYFALTAVAAGAARQGETEIAIRAARQIDDLAAQAAALGAIAVAMAAPQKPLTDIIGNGPGDIFAGKGLIRDLLDEGDDQKTDGAMPSPASDQPVKEDKGIPGGSTGGKS